MDIIGRLFELSDGVYAEFQAKLTPNLARERFIGVRIPLLRSLAKELKNSAQAQEFLRGLPHKYYEEDMLHAMLINEIKDFDECLAALEEFLPYMDNWAVCDSCNPAVFKKNHARLLPPAKKWARSEESYTRRFGLNMFMKHYLDADFDPSLLALAAEGRSEEYYVNMMTAFYFATALAKQWDAAYPYIAEKRLDKWTHNKTIQKATESFRISEERKALLRSMKI
jgi:3-methyladenine DNA glycosylase AlkD